MDVPLFELVGDAVRSATGGRDDIRVRSHGRGVKVWFGPTRPTPEHYEAQLVARRHLDGQGGTVLEIGFHSEHRDDERNSTIRQHLAGHERKWRRALGQAAQLGPFLGNDTWIRLSETWIEPDLDEADLIPEITDRLSTYIDTVEPIRQTAPEKDPKLPKNPKKKR